MAMPGDDSIVAITSPRIADLMVPPLTTVGFPAEEMARIGVESLIALLEGKIGRQSQRCPRAQVTIRQSTGPAASS